MEDNKLDNEYFDRLGIENEEPEPSEIPRSRRTTLPPLRFFEGFFDDERDRLQERRVFAKVTDI